MKDERNRNRVVVTGIGTINPVGNNVDEFWQRLIEGKSGIGPITHFDASDLSCQIAGEVKGFNPLDFVERKEARHMARFTHLAIAAARMAVKRPVPHGCGGYVNRFRPVGIEFAGKFEQTMSRELIVLIPNSTQQWRRALIKIDATARLVVGG